MKAGKLGLLSVALVLGLSACNLINGGNPEPTDPTDPTDPGTPTGGTDTGGNGGGTDVPEGGFGVSLSETGPFLYSGGEEGNITSDDDSRVISVPAGGTFYAQVSATADEPIEAIDIWLVNSGLDEFDQGALPNGGFSVVGDPTGDCALGTSDTVTCTYEIAVAAGTPEIEDLPSNDDEFAYVFRPVLTVGGTEVQPREYRGYVDVE